MALGDTSTSTGVLLRVMLSVCVCVFPHCFSAAEKENLERPLQVFLQLGLGDTLQQQQEKQDF